MECWKCEIKIVCGSDGICRNAICLVKELGTHIDAIYTYIKTYVHACILLHIALATSSDPCVKLC